MSNGAPRSKGRERQDHLPVLQALVLRYHMIQWKTVEPDVSPKGLHEVLGSLPLIDVLAAIESLSRGPLVLFTTEAKRAIHDHVSRRREESGGLLLGFAATLGLL